MTCRKRPDHLMLSHDGNLYDTRNANWMFNNPLRYRYAFQHASIESTHQLKACLRAGSTTDLGGYPCYFVTADGAALSFEAVRAELEQCLDAIRHGQKWSGWLIVACQINYEDGALTCEHTGRRIASAYGESE